ncbi:MAG: radical SAM family heme chaperone HemW [Clostridium sp.]|uniref:radical SAM family heme chaperone HemW n=1 Tax=Clostridium sp. DSM 8431 TaxID=1761781 RepID=UPI0008ED52B0|nr:radical SAM family heme chaperone HemW [Clostridium sp. DSM 8431]MBQ3421061.1 oxygen-independent coproporphyrinogen III oxidase [Romboutsia sp.]MCR4944100.1 radical SAM family heme chaperone HemW [Clostridium sp.]SFU80339.1 oxygen-independent coproporphyrinogen-3 oxidase [Clostridium sp. DSM 8431]
MKEIALYIHIPFCKQKCFYCDFPSYACKENLMDDYIKALVKEIDIKCKNYLIKSLFIGGGTPSHLDYKNLKVLMSAIKKLNFKEDAEKTMECNPGTVDEEKLKIIKYGSINRLSFGLQTTDDALLKSIGRIHTFEIFKENYYLARKIGFDNINIDVMFGLPDQSVEGWIRSLEEVIKLNPEHISSYSLIIEEGTAFYKLESMDKLNLPSEDEERDMYRGGKKFLEAKGYHQYEISNFAKENRECRHNEVYWKCEEYLGVGAASSSFVDEKRFSNIKDIKEYINRINNNESVIEYDYVNTKKDDIEEFMFMGLRMNLGISEKEFERRFGETVDDIYKDVINKNVKLGLLIRNGGRIYLSDKGFEVSNIVMSDMIL